MVKGEKDGIGVMGHGVCVLAPGGAPSLDAGVLILSGGGWFWV